MTARTDQSLTSDMRRALAGLICTTVWHTNDHDAKHSLADRLTVQPFEAMPTEQLVDLAEQLCGEADVMRLLHMCSEDLYEVEATFLCVACRDEHVIDVGHGRWFRCVQCNPYERVEPTSKAKK